VERVTPSRSFKPAVLLLSVVVAVAAAVLPAQFPGAPGSVAAADPLNDGLSPGCSSFNDFVTNHLDANGLSQLLPAIPEPGWVLVDSSQPFKSAAGEVTATNGVAYKDFPMIHDSHDFAFNIVADPGQESLISIVNDPNDEELDVPNVGSLQTATQLHLEWETGIKPTETNGDGAAPTFPSWAWPSTGDRVWANGNWIFDCGHPSKVGGIRHYRTELHPVRAIASMRQQFRPLPGSGATPVAVTATDLYIHGESGFAPDDLACGPDVILPGNEGCVNDPHRTTPIDDNYTFVICTPPKTFDKALLKKVVEDGPGNSVNTPELAPQLHDVDADQSMGSTDPCRDKTKYGPKEVEVVIPLSGSGVAPTAVYARRIYVGWIFPPDNPHHLKVTLNKMILHDDMDTETLDPFDVSGCECTFFWMGVDKSPNEWYRLSNFDVPTDYNGHFGCPSHDNTLDDWDDDSGSLSCGDGSLNFNGPTFDFFVGNNQPVSVTANGYDQDCFDRWIGDHHHTLDVTPFVGDPAAVNGLVLCLTLWSVVTPFGTGACNFGVPGPFDTDECDDNDPFHDLQTTLGAPGYAAGQQLDVPNPDDQYNMQFTVEDVPLGDQDSADLGLTKVCKPDGTAFAGVQFTCTILVTNPSGPGLPRDVVVDDTLLTDVDSSRYTLEPPSFTFGGQTDVSDPCITPDNPIEELPNGKEFHCKIGTVPVGGKAIITVHITSLEGGDFNNLANVTTSSSDANLANNSDRDSVHVQAVSDLSLEKADTPDPLVAGTDITYTLHAENKGPSKAVNVSIEDSLPDSVSIVSVNGGSGASCKFGVPGDGARPTTCNYDSLAPAASANMVIVARVKPGDHELIQNDARVTSDTLDLNNSNNLASASTTIRIADLQIVKSSDAELYKASAQITYSLTVTNNGPAKAENVVVSDDLPLQSKDRVVVLDSDCSLAGSLVTCNLGTMAPLASRTLTIAIVPKGSRGSISNTAKVSSSTFDPKAENNSSTKVVFSGNPPKP
jgi:uncharacterized repeat protein (TIGR01451 family)